MDKWLYRASIALVILGIAVSIYMTIYKLTMNDKMCIGSGDCHTVNASRYSEVNGILPVPIPVAMIGVFGYVAILISLLLETRSEFFKANGTMFTFGLSLTGFLFTVWLIYVELVLLRALCPFCVTSQITMTILFILAIIRLIRQPQNY